MATTLVSTGITFPDGTTQTTAATGGLTATAVTTTAYMNYPTGHYSRQDSSTDMNMTNVPGFPRVDTNQGFYTPQYQQNPRYPQLYLTKLISGNDQNNAPNIDNVPYPNANYTSAVRVRAQPNESYGTGSKKSDVAIRMTYHYIS